MSHDVGCTAYMQFPIALGRYLFAVKHDHASNLPPLAALVVGDASLAVSQSGRQQIKGERLAVHLGDANLRAHPCRVGVGRGGSVTTALTPTPASSP